EIKTGVGLGTALGPWSARVFPHDGRTTDLAVAIQDHASYGAFLRGERHHRALQTPKRSGTAGHSEFSSISVSLNPKCSVLDRALDMIAVLPSLPSTVQAELPGHFHQLGQGVGFHLLHNPAPMCFYRNLANAEFATHLFIQKTHDY